MRDAGRLLLGTGFSVLVSLAACGGKAALDRSERASASAGAGGAEGSRDPSASAGVSPSAGGPCCNFIPSCNAEDQTLNGSNECPAGASCYTLDGCCGAVNHCAHFDAPTVVDAGPPSDAGSCSLFGAWRTHSALWNGESTDAVITFNRDGSLFGSPYFSGSWSLAGSQLTIENTVGPDMNCPYADHWTLTFSDDCQTAPLIPIGTGCTGARRYLDWNVTLTR